MPPKVDITGQRFGRLIALRPTKNRSSYGAVVWECRCDCGKITFGDTSKLGVGGKRSCGCLHKDIVHKNITGKRFGRLIALEAIEQRDKSRGVIWKCKCDCGEVAYATPNTLGFGRVKSCGCLRYAGFFVRGTNIDPMNVPVEVTKCQRARIKLSKAIKQAS